MSARAVDASADAASVTLSGRYVAMGSSYAAGPSIPTNVPGQTCARSTGNYAHLIAAELGLTLVDVSCAGATSDNIALVPQGLNPLQIDALTSDTQLVTITVGGNDIGYAAALSACGSAGAAGSSCLGISVNSSTVDARVRELDAKLTAMLEAIQRAAPKARVFLVAYPRVLPDPAVGCPPDVPMLAADAKYLGDMGARLQASFVASASAAGVHFVDVYSASVGHDACAPKTARWVEGQATPGATAYHPNAAGMRAQAMLIIAAIRATL